MATSPDVRVEHLGTIKVSEESESLEISSNDTKKS